MTAILNRTHGLEALSIRTHLRDINACRLGTTPVEELARFLAQRFPLLNFEEALELIDELTRQGTLVQTKAGSTMWVQLPR